MTEKNTTDKKRFTLKQTAVATTAALALGGVLGTMEAGPVTRDATEQIHAEEVAGNISTDLYDKANFPNGVEVPGFLNGAVVLRTAAGNTLTYRYPIILDETTLEKKPDAAGKFLEGAWIGIPGHNADGKVVILPTQVKLGASKEIADESVSLASPSSIIRPAAGVYASAITGGPDQLMAFDIQGNGNFPSVPVEAAVDK